MAEAMELLFQHKIVFSNQDEISVRDVANSLLANEQMVLAIGEILENCFIGLSVEKVSVDFRAATINSPLTEELGTKLVVQFQEAFRTQIPKLIESVTGLRVDSEQGQLVTTLFLLIVVYGIKKAWELYKAKNEGEEESPPPQIIQNYGVLLNAGGDIAGVSPQTLEAAIERTFPPKRSTQLARMALNFIQPAKREKGTVISGAGLSIDAAAIEAAPSALDVALSEEDEERQTPYEKQKVVIHATDKDHNASGWAGHIIGVCDKRLRMKLFSKISPESLFGKNDIVADIILVSRRNPDGEYRPYMFHVIDVYD